MLNWDTRNSSTTFIFILKLKEVDLHVRHETFNGKITCVEPESVFSRVRSTSKNLNVFITRDENFYGIH